MSAGFSGQKALDVLTYSAKSATASLADQAAVSDALTSMLNAYKDANVSAADGANTLTRIEVYGKAQLQAFSSSLGFTMVTAHAAGLSLHEAGAAMATLSQVSGSHGIRRMDNDLNNLMRSMLSIDDVAKRSKAELKAMGVDDAESFVTVNARAQDMGVTFDKLKFAGMDFIGKLQYLAQLSGYSAAQYNSSREQMILTQFAQINATKGQAQAEAWLNLQHDEGAARFMKMIGGAAAFIPALTLLTDHSKEYTYVLGQMNDKTDTVTNAFNIMRGSTAQQWKMFELAVQNVLVILGLQLLPVVNNVLHALRGIAMAMIGWLQAPGAMDNLKYALLGIAIVIAGPLLGAALAFAQFIGPFVLAIGAIIVVGNVLGNVLRTHPGILAAIQAGWKQLQPLLADAAKLLKQVGDAFAKAWNDPLTQKALKDFQTNIEKVMPLMKVIGAILLGSIVVGFLALIDALRVLAAVLPYVFAFFSDVYGILTAVTVAVMNAPQAFQRLGEAIGRAFSGIGSHVHEWLGDIGSAIGGAFSGLGSGGNAVQTGIVAFFTSAFQGAVSAVRNAIRGIFNLGQWLYENNIYVHVWVDGLRREIARAGQLFSDLGATVHEKLQALGAMIGVGLALVGAQFSQFGALAHNVGDAIGGALSAVAAFIWNGIKLLFGLGVTLILNGIAAWLGTIGSALGLLGQVRGWVIDRLDQYLIRPLQQKFAGAGSAVGSGIQALWATVKLYMAAGFTVLWAWLTNQLANVLALLGFTNAGSKAKAIMAGIKANVIDPAILAFQGLTTGVAAVWDAVTLTIKNAINGIIGLVNGMIHAINGLKIQVPKVDLPGGGSVGGNTIGFPPIPDIPYLAQGGMLSQGGWVMTGDTGRGTGEPAWLPGGAGVVPHNFEDVLVSALSRAGGHGGGSVTYNLAFPNATDKTQIALAVKQIIAEEDARSHTKARRGGFNGGLHSW